MYIIYIYYYDLLCNYALQIANTNERKQKSHVKDPKPSTNTSSQNTGATMPDPRHFRASWLKPGAAVHWAILWWMNVDGRNPAPVGNSLVTMKHCKLWDCKGINMDKPYPNWCRNSSIHSMACCEYLCVYHLAFLQ